MPLALLLPLVALASAAPAALPAELSFATSHCYGPCPVYRVTVRPDGSGLFEGLDHVAVRGSRPIAVGAEGYRALARHLAPLRPRRGSADYAMENQCGGGGLAPTDGATWRVTWREGGRVQRLNFYQGCPQARFRERLRAVPAMLPIGELIGRPGG